MLNNLFILMLYLSAANASLSTSPITTGHHSLERVQASKMNGSEPAGAKPIETLLHDKLLNDPSSPVVGAQHPALKIVSFVNYDCSHCQALDSSLERLLKNYPQVAITYKLIASGSETSIAVTRTALTVWNQHPDRFHTFHHALMTHANLGKDERIRTASKIAGLNISGYGPDVDASIHVNMELLETLHYSGTPTTIIGNTILQGEVSYDMLERVIDQALKSG